MVETCNGFDYEPNTQPVKRKWDLSTVLDFSTNSIAKLEMLSFQVEYDHHEKPSSSADAGDVDKVRTRWSKLNFHLFFQSLLSNRKWRQREFPILLHLRSRQSANQSNSFNYRRAHVTFELITSHELAVWLKCDPIFSAKMPTVCSTAVHLYGMNTKSDCDTTQRTVIVNDSMLNLFNHRVNFSTDSETESRNEGDEQHGKSK